MLPTVVAVVLLFLNPAPALATPFGLKRAPPSRPNVSNVCKDVNAIVSILSELKAPATSFCSSLLHIGTSTITSTVTPTPTTTTTFTTTTSTEVDTTTTITTSTETTSTTTTTTATSIETDVTTETLTTTIGGGAKRDIKVRAAIAIPSALIHIADTILSTACSCLNIQATVATTVTTLPRQTMTNLSPTTTITTTTTVSTETDATSTTTTGTSTTVFETTTTSTVFAAATCVGSNLACECLDLVEGACTQPDGTPLCCSGVCVSDLSPIGFCQ